MWDFEDIFSSMTTRRNTTFQANVLGIIIIVILIWTGIGLMFLARSGEDLVQIVSHFLASDTWIILCRITIWEIGTSKHDSCRSNADFLRIRSPIFRSSNSRKGQCLINRLYLFSNAVYLCAIDLCCCSRETFQGYRIVKTAAVIQVRGVGVVLHITAQAIQVRKVRVVHFLIRYVPQNLSVPLVADLAEIFLKDKHVGKSGLPKYGCWRRTQQGRHHSGQAVSVWNYKQPTVEFLRMALHFAERIWEHAEPVPGERHCTSKFCQLQSHQLHLFLFLLLLICCTHRLYPSSDFSECPHGPIDTVFQHLLAAVGNKHESVSKVSLQVIDI